MNVILKDTIQCLDANQGMSFSILYTALFKKRQLF